MSLGTGKLVIVPVEVCRLCLWKSESMLPIFEGDGNHQNVAKKIKTLLPFDVSMDGDGLPKQVCSVCAYKLEVFYGFYNSCLRCNNKLKDYTIPKKIQEITIEEEEEEKKDDDDDGDDDDEPENRPIKVEDSQRKNQPSRKNQSSGATPSDAPVPAKDHSDIITDVKDRENSPGDERYSSGGDPVPFPSTISIVQETEPEETTQSLEETWSHDNCSESIPPSHAFDHCCSSVSVLNCRYCNKVFYEIRSLHAHEKLHNGGVLLYSCRTCGKEFYSDSDLKIHVNISCTREVHSNSQFSKPFAAGGVQFSKPFAAGGVSFPCRVCNKILRSVASFLKHNKSRQHLMRLKNTGGPSVVKSSTQRLIGKASRASKTRKTTNKSLVFKDKLVPHSVRVSNNSSTIHQRKRKLSSRVANPAVVKRRKKLK